MFTVKTHKPNSRHICLYISEESQASQIKRKAYVSNLFWLTGQWSSKCVLPGQTINEYNYWEGLHCLRQQAHRKCLDQWYNQAGWYTMTLCQCMQLCQHSYFWSLKTWLWDPTPLLAWIGPLRFLLVSKNKIAITRALFPGCTWNSRTITNHPACYFNSTQLQKCFQTWQKHWTYCINSEQGNNQKQR